MKDIHKSTVYRKNCLRDTQFYVCSLKQKQDIWDYQNENAGLKSRRCKTAELTCGHERAERTVLGKPDFEANREQNLGSKLP